MLDDDALLQQALALSMGEQGAADVAAAAAPSPRKAATTTKNSAPRSPRVSANTPNDQTATPTRDAPTSRSKRPSFARALVVAPRAEPTDGFSSRRGLAQFHAPSARSASHRAHSFCNTHARANHVPFRRFTSHSRRTRASSALCASISSPSPHFSPRAPMRAISSTLSRPRVVPSATTTSASRRSVIIARFAVGDTVRVVADVRAHHVPKSKGQGVG